MSNEEMPVPLPCPFCGSTNLTWLTDPIGMSAFIGCISCIECQSHGPAIWEVENELARMQATKLWNRRDNQP